MTVTVFGRTYNIDAAPAFVRYGITLWTRRYGTDLDVRTPTAVRHYVNLLAVRFGVLQ